jgi:hypothetical protein
VRNKEDIECFKWYKNDRICWLCPYENECMYEYDLRTFINEYYCPNQLIYYGSISSPRCDKDEKEGEYISPDDKEYCIGIDKCKSKEIENWKRKYKLKNIKNEK